MKNVPLGLVALLLLPLPASAGPFIADKSRSYGELQDQAMDIMHHQMHLAQKSEDPDTAFAAMMVPHHQGAIDMAKALLLHGKDPAMRNLALQIIAEQQTEIDLMNEFLKQRKSKISKKEK